MFFRYRQVTDGRIGLGLSSSTIPIILIGTDTRGVVVDGPARLTVHEARQFAYSILALCGEISTSSELNKGVVE